MTENKFGITDSYFSEEEIAEMMSPALKEERMRQAKFKEFVSQILSGDSEDNAGPYEMRCIVERDSWFIPKNKNGSPEILNVKKGEFTRLWAGVSKRDGRRTVREGRGGQLLPIYQELPESVDRSNYVEMNGRQLVRSLPKGITGLLAQSRIDEPMRELDFDHFDTLLGLADAIELEDSLMVDGPIETAPLLNYKFRVAMYKTYFWNNSEVASIATFEDRQFFNSDECRVEMMTGREIFTRLLEDGSYAGAVLNPSNDIGRKGEHIRGLFLSLNFMQRALTQSQCQLRLPEFTVRSREEFDEWLLNVYFPKPNEVIEEKDSSGKTFFHSIARGTELEWDIRECQYCDKTSQVQTPKFELRPAPATNEDEMAAGASVALCPAKLAQNLFCQLPERNRRDYVWAPGKNVGLGRLLSESDIAASKERIIMATELLKLIPAGADSIPPSAMKSVDAAQFVRRMPQIAKREWAESALQQAKKYCKKFVLR